MKLLYMKIDVNDRLKLPLAVADSAGQLADMVGTHRSAIIKSVRKTEKDGKERMYVRVAVDDE